MSKPSGLSRRELWVDARDLQSDADPDNPMTREEYTAVLTGRGREKMAEHRLVQSFGATVRTRNATYELGKDFQLGDTITATDDRLGVSAGAIAEGAAHAVSRDGETAELQMGYGQPTIFDIMKRKVDK